MKPMTKKKLSSMIHLPGVIGAVIILVVIIGGFAFGNIFAFWKFEGNIPGIIQGGYYILPLGTFLARSQGFEDISTSIPLISFCIYLPFIFAGILGLIGSLLDRHKLIIVAGLVGICAVPLSIFITTQLVVMYGIKPSGMEWTALFVYDYAMSGGNYTQALWVGFYGCAAGSYLIYFNSSRPIGRQKNQQPSKDTKVS